MNSYLKTGGRLVGAVVFAIGVLFVAGAFAALAVTVQRVVSDGYSAILGSRRTGFGLDGVGLCGFMAYLCFRYWSRLRKEEREGV
jgi:hypothetical protein